MDPELQSINTNNSVAPDQRRVRACEDEFRLCAGQHLSTGADGVA